MTQENQDKIQIMSGRCRPCGWPFPMQLVVDSSHEENQGIFKESRKGGDQSAVIKTVVYIYN